MPVSSSDKAAALAQVPLFSGITAESIAQVANVAGEQEFPAGTFIVRQGQIGSGLYVIVSGTARVLRGGEELARLGPGEFFGELAVIDQRPRNASVQAETAVVCLAVASWDLLALLEADPQLSLNLIRGLVDRLRAVGEQHHH